MCYSKNCNFCSHLVKTNIGGSVQRFDAACGIVTYEAFGESRHRRIDSGLRLTDDIPSPPWCPRDKIVTKTAEQPTQVYTSYSDRREKMKLLRRSIKWEDIQEGEIYVIPKILNQPRKIVRVVTKTDLSCMCHEINENTGNEYSYTVNVYKADLDAIFLNKIHNF